MTLLQVMIVVAVDDVGRVECVPYLPYHIQMKNVSDAFIKEKREDKFHQWQISYLKANVPFPFDPMITAEVVDKL